VRVLVTGGAGYVGSTLVPVLLQEGHQVRVLDRLDSGGHGLLGCVGRSGFSFIHGDMGDETVLMPALGGVEAVIHLAAIVGYPACQQHAAEAVATNVNATKLLLDLRHTSQRLLLASTGSVYGAIAGGICTETTPCSPITLYGVTKAEAENLTRAAGNHVIFRYATAFGPSPCMRFDLLPNHFVQRAVRDGKLALYQGGFRRTFIHVRDIARSISFALREWAGISDETYNVGHESLNITKAGLARMIRGHVNYQLDVDESATDSDQRDYDVCYRKIRQKGFTAKHDLDQGIAELVQVARLTGQPANSGRRTW
jgi:nucleoside-diphosphate-sugar epimerase